MNQLSIKMKLGISFGVLLLIMATMAVVSDISIRQLSDLSDEGTKQSTKMLLARDMDNSLELQTSSVRGFVLSGAEGMLSRRNDGQTDFDKAEADLRPMLQTEKGKMLSAHIHDASLELRGIQDRAVALRRAGKGKEASELLFTAHSTQIREDLEKSIDDLTAICTKLQEDAQALHESTEARTVRMLLTLAGVGLLVGIAVSITMARAIGSSTSRMLSMIEQIAAKQSGYTRYGDQIPGRNRAGMCCHESDEE